MKKTLTSLFLLSVAAFAQGPGTGPNPADLVSRLTKLLDLTASQQTQATTIFTNELTAIAPIQTEVMTAHTSLTAAVKSNSTTTIDTLSAQLGTYNGQITDIQSKAQAAFYAILTASQQTKYDAMGGGFGGPGGGPGARPAFRGARPPQ
jgi:Spy/CpxP family protein refolding chaperone